jgi:hypothetical protein
METNPDEFDVKLDPYKLREVTFISYEDAGFTMEEIARLCSRGLEVQCFKVPGDTDHTVRMNFAVMDGTPARRIQDAFNEGRVIDEDVQKFVTDARFLESDETFATAWSDFV